MYVRLNNPEEETCNIICHFSDIKLFLIDLVYGVSRHCQQYFNYIVAVSFIGGGNRSTW
jgi:hypothetical protein